MLEKVIENWTSRLDYIRARRGSPMPEIIFKINSDDVNLCQDLILPRSSKPNRHSRYLLHAVKSYDMATIDFLHHENPPTWAGFDPRNFDAEASDKPIMPPCRFMTLLY
ncbi:hypothetical protein TNCV_4544711 [Trichonephila clavipes]|nr:hypothetical protein TNCV_4544711 [Trichonephila clavipes]